MKYSNKVFVLLCAIGAGQGFAQTSAPSAAVNPAGRASAPAPVAAAAPAAAGAPEIPALRVAVTQVSDSRNSSGNNRISLQLGISGDGLPPISAVRSVTVTKAVDSADRVVPASSMGAARVTSMNNMSAGAAMTPVLRATADLGGVARNVESLKYVEGVIEIYMPSESTGSLVRIPTIKAHDGRVEHPVLAKYGIAFHYLASKESNDEVRALLAGTGMAANMSGAEPNGTTAIAYFYRDPSSRMAGYQLQDKTGAAYRTSGGGGWSSRTEAYSSATLTGPLPDDVQLVIFVASDEAIRKVPFRVEEIQLP